MKNRQSVLYTVADVVNLNKDFRNLAAIRDPRERYIMEDSDNQTSLSSRSKSAEDRRLSTKTQVKFHG